MSLANRKILCQLSLDRQEYSNLIGHSSVVPAYPFHSPAVPAPGPRPSDDLRLPVVGQVGRRHDHSAAERSERPGRVGVGYQALSSGDQLLVGWSHRVAHDPAAGIRSAANVRIRPSGSCSVGIRFRATLTGSTSDSLIRKNCPVACSPTGRFNRLDVLMRTGYQRKPIRLFKMQREPSELCPPKGGVTISYTPASPGWRWGLG